MILVTLSQTPTPHVSTPPTPALIMSLVRLVQLQSSVSFLEFSKIQQNLPTLNWSQTQSSFVSKIATMILNPQHAGDWSSKIWRLLTTFLGHKLTANMWWTGSGTFNSKILSLQDPSGFSALPFVGEHSAGSGVGAGHPRQFISPQHTLRRLLAIASHHATQESPTDWEDLISKENAFKYEPRG